MHFEFYPYYKRHLPLPHSLVDREGLADAIAFFVVDHYAVDAWLEVAHRKNATVIA